MPYNYTECNRNQMYLLPPNMMDWLPENHFAWFLIDVISQMDLSAFHAAHRPDGKGQKAHNPAIMLGVLLYGYCRGERSSRRLETLCMESVPYRILAANTAPDHCAFARFRQRHAAAMKSFFVETLRLCAEAGLMKVGKVNLDGTKMKADASLSANRTEKALAGEIDKMLAEAEAKDAEDDTAFGKDRRGDELPEDLRTREGRFKRLQECKARLEEERIAAEESQRKKIEERKREENETGRKKRGRQPKSVEDVSAKLEKRKANATAPETRIMKTRSGYVQGFNAQAVCTDDQIILAADVIDRENDQGQYHPMMGQAQLNATAALGKKKGKINLGRADAGYCNEADLERKCEYEMLVATRKDWKRRKELRDTPLPRGRIPKGLTATQRMERKFRTKHGSVEYRKRSQTIEPVFGQIKSGRGIDSFYGRELVSAKGEWNLICGTHNLLKLFVWSRTLRN
ncbi:MAG: transposase [Pseudomonadota bacterium]|nr:transposase [Pseudomonadota bacterium]